MLATKAKNLSEVVLKYLLSFYTCDYKLAITNTIMTLVYYFIHLSPHVVFAAPALSA